MYININMYVHVYIIYISTCKYINIYACPHVYIYIYVYADIH